MTTNPTPSTHPSTRPSGLPVLAAVVVTAAALLHLLLGPDTPTRTTLSVLAVGAGLVVGVLAASPRAPRLLVTSVALVGIGAVVLLGVTYL